MMEQSRLDVRTVGLFRPGASSGLWRTLIQWQAGLAARFDGRLPTALRVDGNLDFIDEVVPRYLRSGMVVYDVGGGRYPLIAPERSSALNLRVVGLDSEEGELASAPEGSYESSITADICTYRGNADADLVICQALLEHVQNVDSALRAIAGILKPGGRALMFVPCRNALYARINLLLPEPLKRRILFAIFPEMRRGHGFRAYYDRCTPAALMRLAAAHGLKTDESRQYYESQYFRFCFPLHLAWRMWVLLFRALAPDAAAETLSLVLRKDE